MERREKIEEAKKDLERLKARIPQVKDEAKRREALEHLQRMRELVVLEETAKREMPSSPASWSPKLQKQRIKKSKEPLRSIWRLKISLSLRK